MRRAHRVRCVLLGSLPLVLPALAGAQNLWHVDVNSTPPGLGTPTHPYTSIQYAIERPTTKSGDTVLVAPGTYVENLKDYPKTLHVRSRQGPLVTELRPLDPGAATVYWESFSTIEGFTLTGNASNGLNGGALNLSSSSAVSCIVRDNPGLGVYAYSATLRNCTILGPGSGIVVEFFSDITLKNTIVTSSFMPGALGTYADYCAGALPAGTTGVGNLNGDPGLWDIPGARERLRPGSPCIDAGDPSSPPDPDGSRADIGAVPYDATFGPTAAYCAGKPNSSGCTPAIGALGTPSATSAAPFSITAVDEVTNKLGFLLLAVAPSAQPFQGGLLCLAPPFQRLGAQNSGGSAACSGTYAFDMGAYIQSGADPALVAGAQAYCQWWNRDPQDPAGFGTGLSNALVFGIAP